MQPKPTLDIDIHEFRHMRNLMIKVQDKAIKIRNLQYKVLLQLKQQLADTKGLFKGKERKALWNSITVTLLSGNTKSAGNRQPTLKSSTDHLKSRAC